MKSPKYIYRYDASIRIGGIGSFHPDILARTNLNASHQHLAGDRRSPTAKPWEEDLWSLESPLNESLPLAEHAEWLWMRISPHKYYFKLLIKEAAWADICFGCRTNCSWPILEVDATSLTILRELPLSLSFNFTLE